MSDPVYLSVVIPAYNEAKKIRNDIHHLYTYLNRQSFSYEVIVVDDGSADETRMILEELEDQYRNLRCRCCPQNRGKGHAVKTGILEARGEVIFFADAGTCVPYAETERGLSFIREGYDIAVGSRALLESNIVLSQPKYRQIGSKVFGLLARTVMGVRQVKDLQCGFKFFTRRAAMAIFPTNTINGMMFDIETIIKAQQLNLQIKEFPVTWKNDPDTKLKPLTGGIRILWELFLVRCRARSFPREKE